MKSFRKGKVALFGLSLAALCAGGVYASSLIANTAFEKVSAADAADVLTPSNVAAEGYTTNVTYESPSTGVSYVTAAYPNDDAIQLRSDGNSSGIVVSKTGGSVASITIDLSATTSTRNVDLYTSTTAYTSPTELYAKGLTVAHTFISNDESTWTYTPSSTVTYFGIRSRTKTVYLTSLTVNWTGLTLTPGISVTAIDNPFVGDTGALTYTVYNVEGETPAVTWESSNPSVLEVNSSTGAYTAKAFGDCIVTAKMTVDGKEYSDSLTVGVDGVLSVSEAYAYGERISGTSEARATVYGDVGTAWVSNQVILSESDTNMTVYGIYDNSSSYSLVSGWAVGDTVAINGKIQNGDYGIQITSPALIHAAEYAALANALLADECSDLSVQSATWTTLSEIYGNSLSADNQTTLKNAVADASGDEIARFASRYDYIVAKYGYSDFADRGVSGSANLGDTDSMGVIIPVSVLFGLILVAGITIPMVIRRRKED